MGKNLYVRRAKISESKFRQFLRCFALDMEATKIAQLCRLNRNTVNRLSKAVRERMAEACEQEQGGGGVNRDGPPPEVPVRILRSRHARRCVWRIVSGRVLPDGYVQIQVDETASLVGHDAVLARWPTGAGDATDHPSPASVPRIDTLPAHDPPLNRATKGRGPLIQSSRLRTLDNFWGQAMLRLAKFKGVSRRTYQLHLKECQFRFNHRREDLYSLLLRHIRKRPLF